jgi:predicted negative regulator of RcsB-dependent stress response
MTTRARLLGLTLASALLGGCVYYNGMYNANRLAGSARKAEREGRTFEANNLWGQVATKAESVVVRHPTSKYAEEAGVLRGVALARLGQCEQALGALSRASSSTKHSELSEDALLAAGTCQLAQGNLPASEAAFGQLLDSKDRDRRKEARFHLARLMRQSGRYEEALRTLEGLRDSRAESERILALAGVGRVPQALSLADSLIARHDTTRPWDTLVVILGRQSPAAASQLVDRLRPLSVGTPELQGSRLVEDGIRLVNTDTARAASRFREAIAMGSSSDAAGRASLQLVLMDLRHAQRAEDLPRVVTALKQLAGKFEAVAYEASQLAASAEAVHGAATTLTWETPQGDLRLFLAGEAARDSLRAPALAAGLFHRILQDYPNSSYAAKVVFAVQQLDPTWTDSARGLLETRYLDSPYLAMIRGEGSDEYRQLEDSLGAYAAALAPKPLPPAGVRRRPTTSDDVDDPGHRARAPGTSNVPEP